MRKICSFVLVLVMLFAMASKTFAYWEGDTKVVTNWWGVEIYLSKSTVQHIGEGAAVGGVFIPEPLVTKILAVYGFGIRFLPGGIVLEYDYIKMGVSALSPGLGLGLVRAITTPTGFRWQ